jgi:hypothetical protein
LEKILLDALAGGSTARAETLCLLASDATARRKVIVAVTIGRDAIEMLKLGEWLRNLKPATEGVGSRLTVSRQSRWSMPATPPRCCGSKARGRRGTRSDGERLPNRI